MFHLEAWIIIVTFCERLVKIHHFVKDSWKRLIFEDWIATFGESLVENAPFGSLQSVKRECPFKTVKQEFPAKVSIKSVQRECPARVTFQESPVKECPAKSVKTDKSAHQECPASPATVSSPARVSRKVC